MRPVVPGGAAAVQAKLVVLAAQDVLARRAISRAISARATEREARSQRRQHGRLCDLVGVGEHGHIVRRRALQQHAEQGVALPVLGAGSARVADGPSAAVAVRHGLLEVDDLHLDLPLECSREFAGCQRVREERALLRVPREGVPRLGDKKPVDHAGQAAQMQSQHLDVGAHGEHQPQAARVRVGLP
eukprot:2898163-Prymnesium_polylepis.1